MKRVTFFFIGVMTCFTLHALPEITNPESSTKVGGSSDKTFQNPVLKRSLPDPTIIKAEDGYFYLFATEDTRNVPILKSADLINWEDIGTAFTRATRPKFVPRGGIWAPDISYIEGKYVLYYSKSEWGKEWECGIGRAVSDKPEGPYTDLGCLFLSNEIDVQNSIDAFYIEDEGKKYLFWGSFRGIYAIELSNDGLSLKDGAEKIRVAGTYFEGVYIHKRGKYYYMFASIGSCCNSLESTYELVVGRSESLLEGYVDAKGKPMLNNGYKLVIGKNERFVGNGHCSEIVQDDAGSDWLFYHGWDATSADSGRVLLLSRILWDENDWPYVEGGSPGEETPAPKFNK